LQIESESKRRLFQCVEKALDARFVWEALPTRRVVQGVVDGQLDLAFPMGFNEERAARMLQSLPTWDNPDLWLSLRPVSPRTPPCAWRPGSARRSSADHASGFARMVGAYTYEELAKTLAMGMVDAVIVPQSVYEEMKALWPPGVVVHPGALAQLGLLPECRRPPALGCAAQPGHRAVP
jgi:hypothetical protein